LILWCRIADLIFCSFFNNLASFTFVGTRNFFHRPDRNQLLLREPLLCTAILLISSRHHSIPAAASLARRFFIHDELWGRASQLIQRLMLGQGQLLRSIASIEALLLLAEWYPAPLNARSSWDEIEDDGGLLNEAADDSYKYKSTSTTHILKQQDQTRWMLPGAAQLAWSRNRRLQARPSSLWQPYRCWLGHSRFTARTHDYSCCKAWFTYHDTSLV
jgi:hypothetical protein